VKQKWVAFQILRLCSVYSSTIEGTCQLYASSVHFVKGIELEDPPPCEMGKSVFGNRMVSVYELPLLV